MNCIISGGFHFFSPLFTPLSQSFQPFLAGEPFNSVPNSPAIAKYVFTLDFVWL